VVGDSIEVSLGYTDQYNLRIELFDNIVERITEVDRVTGKILNAYSVYNVFPANEYTRSKEQMRIACDKIEKELHQRLNDREPGQRPFNLFDYFPDDYLLVIDESHVSIPQSRGMFNGDRARKETLVKYGFRLPSALENRPMRFDEFEKIINQVIYVSATPGDYELEQVNHEVVQQIIRPTGLIDPKVTIRPSQGQIDDIIHEINVRIARNERTLITTLTVKMAEELSAYLKRLDLKVVFLHHEVKTFERIEVLRDLRRGKYDVLVGINLLREGLDLPEVSLVCILDADKEGFLRSHRSLIQTIGRAARNSNGEVILYADRITDSMEKAISETNRRREIQIAYNIEHNITPTTIIKEIHDVIRGKETQKMAKEYLTKRQKFDRKAQEELILSLEKEMHEAAKVLDFERAAELRDIILELKSSWDLKHIVLVSHGHVSIQMEMVKLMKKDFNSTMI